MNSLIKIPRSEEAKPRKSEAESEAKLPARLLMGNPKTTCEGETPPSTPSKKRSRHRINCSLSNSERRWLKKKAKAHGLPIATMLKKAAFAQLLKGTLLPAGIEENLHALTLQLRGMGNNLNQIARKANWLGKVGLKELWEVKSILKSSEEKVINFVKGTNPTIDDHQIDEQEERRV